jgi:hypothetical protein
MNLSSFTAARTKTAIAMVALAALCALGIAPASAASTIPVGTKFSVNLATPDINTKNAQPGDQFTMAVVAPYPNNNPKYNGAMIYGHVTSAVAAAQGRKAVLNLAFDKIAFPDGQQGLVAGTMIAAKTVSENTTARKALGAGAGMAVGSQTVGRILGGAAGGVVGMLGGAAAGYAYANNAKANFSLVKGAAAVVQTTAPTHVRPQARY